MESYYTSSGARWMWQDLSKDYKQVNIDMAMGPGGLLGHILRACTDQLVSSQTFSTFP